MAAKAGAKKTAKMAAPPADAPPAPAPIDQLSLIPREQREALEKLSANLARAAMTAQGAMAEAALRQADGQTA
ncbi:MAG TPA: class I poly(R)-hydroxyalkanoic acid synthase, partial [Caulobacteraceae bacterium]|nr:class I poly(R)-hydroxyalkanoic acid synthase [Caulobacteraceae bacterium]